MCTINEDHIIYDSEIEGSTDRNLSYDEWFLRYGVGQTEFFVILERFLSFYPPMDPEKKIF